MMSDLTARIEALETTYELQSAREAVVLAEYTVRSPDATFDAQWALDAAAELLTALEQANKNTEGLADYIRECVTECHKAQTIGAARLKLAEQRADQAEADFEAASDAYDKCTGVLYDNLKQAESLKRSFEECAARLDIENSELRAALAAERAKRCATCEHEYALDAECEFERDCPIKLAIEVWAKTGNPPACSGWQPRREVTA